MSGDLAACACGTCPSCTGSSVRPAVADPLVYRHGAIKARMLSRIAAVEIEGIRPLAPLGTRETDDPSIALIDAFAGSLHILAYSAARLSDDGSILRSQDRDALARLTRTLGYEPRPALSASTTLSFTVNSLAGGPTEAVVPAGTKVASVPEKDEKPQMFETGADLDARAIWNELRPVAPTKTIPAAIKTAIGGLTIAGTGSAAKPGDTLLAYLAPQPSGSKSWLKGKIDTVERETDPKLPAQTRLSLIGNTALSSIAAMDKASFADAVMLMGQRAAAFGATAPNLDLIDPDISGPLLDATTGDWKDLIMDKDGKASGGTLDLDAVYADAMRGRFVMFATATKTQIGLITKAVERSRTDFGLSGKVTRITVQGIDLTGNGFNDKVRATSILIQTARERLLRVDRDIEVPGMPADRLTVIGAAALPPGRTVVLAGEAWGAPDGTALSEVARIKSSSVSGGQTELVFEAALTGHFHSATLRILANSVAATHGEKTPNNGVEPVGSGDAARRTPRYVLKSKPLSYVPATNAQGYAPALEVRVNDRLYDEAPTLFALPADSRAYTVKTVEDGVSELQFAGRLPTGANNVTALYRVGSGSAGNLDADRLATIITPVLGIMGVSNKVPADGGSDAETSDELRASAPQSIRTLERVVSLSDFEVFARRFRGIGKALATELRVGMRRVVLITIATSSLKSPVAGSDTITGLAAAIAAAGAPGRKVRVEGFTDLLASVTIAFAADPALRRSDVEAAIRAALGTRFDRAARGFGEALHESAVLAAVQGVPGVVAARIAAFSLPNGPAASNGRLPCPAPMIDNGVFTPAGLLTIDPAAVQFAEMAI